MKLTCGIVRDLLPLYADRLTGEESSEAVKTHLAECEACRAVFREMTNAEAEQPEERAEIDYLKKVRRSKKRLLLGALAAVLVLTAGTFVWLRIRMAQPLAHFDATTKTLIVNGTGGYDAMQLPAQADEAVNLDAQDDRFHLSAYLPALRIKARTGQSAREFLPGFLEETDKSLEFLRNYLKENAPNCGAEENASKFVELIIRKKGNNAYETGKERITLEIGDYFWHRDDLYVLALMNTEQVQWQQIGYATYLADCVNPYGAMKTERTEGVENERYYEAYLALGGAFDSSPEDFLRLNHAIAYVCLTEGMGWGSAYMSQSVAEYGLYSGPDKVIGGNDMSPAMATSFIGWLDAQFGFADLSAFCFGHRSFSEAFGTTFTEAYAAWSDWLLAACR